MKSLKKSSSSPILEHPIIEANTNNKQKKQYIQQLQNQVNKSRIAVVHYKILQQNINHNRKIQNNLYKNIQELQKELHKCILQINHQTNKNVTSSLLQKTLEELIIVLKGEMNKVQAVQRNEEEYETNNFQKKIKKVEYDIKQILQKYNQEIAKIKNLKEEANASRDERVVYSNLFNKIQKQIKHYEKIYKQTLIKNEVFLDKKRQNHDKKQNALNQSLQFKQQMPEHMYRQQSKRSHVSQSKSKPDVLKSKEVKLVCENKKSLKTGDLQPFLTSVKETQKKYNFQKSATDSVASKTKSSTFNINYERLIDEKQGEIQQIILNSQCKNMEEVLERYKDIYSENDNLILEIQSIDQNIELFQFEIEKLKLQKRTSEVYENGQLSEIININKHSRNNKHMIYEQISQEQKNKNLIFTLCKKLKIELQNDEIIINNELLKDIDEKVQQLGCIRFQQRKKKDSVMITFDQFNSNIVNNDKIVCDLLDKIERFNECEKIFDRNMLKTEYQKELNRIKKKTRKNN